MGGEFTEDGLIQKTTADYFENELGWRSVYAYNSETFGDNGTLGRQNDGEVVLTRYLLQALKRYSKGLNESAYDQAIKQIQATSVSKNTLQINREKYKLFKDGVPVSFRDAKGEIQDERLKVFDFEHPEDNDFLVVRELWISRTPYRRRADLVGFVNGIPLLFIEEMDDEEKRAVRDGLDEERLALFDILPKPNMTKRDRERVKAVAGDLLDALKEEKLKVENWRDKEATKAEVHTYIRDFLWDENRGLAVDVYNPEEVKQKAELVYTPVFRQYADAWQHAYAA